MTPQAISVSEFLSIINETLGFAYPQVTIEGEVSSFKVNQGKFVFFDLKDDKNTLSCFMMVHQLKLPIEDGMKIRATGTPKITKFSKFSLTVKDIELAGEGQLKRAMELLKRKLDAEGLFDPSRKRPLPAFPQRIGLITSQASAAYSDFMKILSARWGGLDVVLADISVQGVSAPDQIVGAIDYFNHLSPPVDVLVAIRGGGSLEDLMAFSTEPVARAVAASRTPIIVGVGHEIDVSLADHAADVRAATPTDAARIVVPDRNEIRARVEHAASRHASALEAIVTNRGQRIIRGISSLEAALRQPRERVLAATGRLEQARARIIQTSRAQTAKIDGITTQLTGHTIRLRRDRLTAITGLERLLQGYNPTAVLGRGYAIVRAGANLVRRADAVKPGDAIMVQLATGNIGAKVTTTHDDKAI